MPVHALLQGHQTNIGDSALRRAYLASLSRLSGHVSLWAGQTQGGYVEGLAPGPNNTPRKSFLDWYLRATIDALCGRAHIALNAGQYTLTTRYLVQTLPLVLLCGIARVTGGSVIWMGAAVPQPKLGRTWLFRILSRLATTAYWRDSMTETYIPGGDRMPDWAFALGQTGPQLNDRPFLAVSLRGDRQEPSSEWLAALQEAAESLSLEITFVTQVDEDNDRHTRLASALHAHHVAWQSDSHPEQEALVRATYARSSVVVSDRLHALIMGITEGAVPLGWTESNIDKISRHLDHLGFDWTVHSANEAPDRKLREITPSTYTEMQASTLHLLDAARGSIDACVSKVSDKLATRS